MHSIGNVPRGSMYKLLSTSNLNLLSGVAIHSTVSILEMDLIWCNRFNFSVVKHLKLSPPDALISFDPLSQRLGAEAIGSSNQTTLPLNKACCSRIISAFSMVAKHAGGLHCTQDNQR